MYGCRGVCIVFSCHIYTLQLKLDHCYAQRSTCRKNPVEAYFQLTTPDKQKGVRELYDDFKKQGYKRQTTSHQDSFCM